MFIWVVTSLDIRSMAIYRHFEIADTLHQCLVQVTERNRFQLVLSAFAAA